MARRGRRGGSHEMDVDGDEIAPRPEDSITIVDEEGKPLTDTGNVSDEDDFRIAGVEMPAAPVMPERQDPTPPADDAYKVLERNFEALKAADAEKTSRLAALEDERKLTAEDTRATQRALLGSGLDGAKNDLNNAKVAYAAAMAKGDYDAASEAQVSMVSAVQDAREFEQAIGEFDRAPAPTTRRQEKTETTPAQVPFNEAVDKFISTLTPETQAFAKKYRGDIFKEGAPRLDEVMAIHQLAVTRRIKPDTPEYFKFIEKQMDLKEPTAQPAADNRSAPRSSPPARTRRPPMAAAPVNGGNAPAVSQVALSRAELNMAKRLGMTPERYGLHKKTALERAHDPDYQGPRYSQDDPAMRGAR